MRHGFISAKDAHAYTSIVKMIAEFIRSDDTESRLAKIEELVNKLALASNVATKEETSTDDDHQYQ